MAVRRRVPRVRLAVFGVIDRLAGRLGYWAVLAVVKIPGRPLTTGSCAGCGDVGAWLQDDVDIWCPRCGGAGVRI